MRRSVLVGTVFALAFGSAYADPRTLPAWPRYERLCSPCHGMSGDGHGPAAPFTRGRPRAFAGGTFAWRSTPIGSPPTRDDLGAAIRFGVPGTSMPAFALSATELDELVDVVIAFAPAAFTRAGAPIALSAPPPIDRGRGAALWAQHGCVACHGEGGRGDGPAAIASGQRPHDLTSEPLRRPRAADDADARRRAAATSIATGLAGTPMPGYADALSEVDIWALADHVVALAAHARSTRRAFDVAPTAVDDRDTAVRTLDRATQAVGRSNGATRTLDAAAIAADRAAPILSGTWPGRGDPMAAIVFGAAVSPQGPPPTGIEPSLAARDCGRCHTKQHREWQGSIHGAATAPGVRAQLDHALTPAKSASCRRCHAPLAEQTTDLALRAEGVQCAGCHVRQWTRHGPPEPSLPKRAAGYPAVALSLYERSDFCLPCHQLPPRTAVAGKPLLDTYREWLEGPYMARGTQCQDCHMPERAHTFRGIHDPDMFRRAITLSARAHARDGKVTVVATLANTGAGHAVPTTATPAVWLRLELLDARGAAIASDVQRIGRELTFDGAWHERADTRILPGERTVMARAWKTPRAASARVTVEVQPDALYERIYASRLANRPSPAARALLEQALTRARGSRYIAEQRTIAIARPATR